MDVVSRTNISFLGREMFYIVGSDKLCFVALKGLMMLTRFAWVHVELVIRSRICVWKRRRQKLGNRELLRAEVSIIFAARCTQHQDCENHNEHTQFAHIFAVH